MKRYNEYRTVIFMGTTAVVFAVWGKLQASITALEGLETFYAGLVGVLVSLGTYELILNVVEFIAINFQPLKKFIFGRTYLDGVWVGAYMGYDGTPRYYIEYYEQDFDSLIIRSKCFYSDKSYKGDWKSTNVAIDEEKGELYYTYTVNTLDKGIQTIGFAIFSFDRRDKGTAPERLIGFSSEVKSGVMIKSVEEKVPNADKLTEEQLLDKAIEVYERNKDTILKE